MEALKVLLIDNSDTTKEALDRAPQGRSLPDFDVTLVPARNGNSHGNQSLASADVIMIGEKLSRKKVVEWTGKLRAMGYGCPILLLTRQSEARLPLAYQEAGIDDFLNIAEISTPLFSWTFTSTMQAIVERRKASEYDYLRDRLNSIKYSLTALMHELNTPLSVIRLAVYHLENSKPTRSKRDLYHSMMVENVERIESKLKDLYHIRRLLTIERKVSSPVSGR